MLLLSRGAESRTCARGQLKYDGFSVLWTRKQTEKMPQFCPNYDVISKKKKVFAQILRVFPVEIWWFKKRVFRPQLLISQCHFDGPLWAHWPYAEPTESNGLPEAHGPLKFLGPGVIVPPAPPLLVALLLS